MTLPRRLNVQRGLGLVLLQLSLSGVPTVGRLRGMKRSFHDRRSGGDLVCEFTRVGYSVFWAHNTRLANTGVVCVVAQVV